MTLPPLAVVAGTGFYDLDALEGPTEETVETAWGAARVVRGHWHGLPVVFLTRHGAGHSVPPHLVNYRRTSGPWPTSASRTSSPSTSPARSTPTSRPATSSASTTSSTSPASAR